jgi:hypothetical protein
MNFRETPGKIGRVGMSELGYSLLQVKVVKDNAPIAKIVHAQTHTSYYIPIRFL